MPPPKQAAAEEAGFAVSWQDILGEWDTVYADLNAVYGSGLHHVSDWPNLRRLILGLMARKESIFATTKALEHRDRLEQQT